MTVAEQIRAEEQLSAALTQYAGRWVAVDGHQVVADADSLDQLLEQLTGEEVEAVFQVPAETGIACFF